MDQATRKLKQRERILDAAAQLFASQGYRGTSTREIARLAEVAANTLFRYFEQKEELFWAVLHSRLSAFDLRKSLRESLAEERNPEIVLPQLVDQLLDTATLNPELLRLVVVAWIEFQRKAAVILKEYLAPIFGAIRGYLDLHIADGELRELDPSLVASALIATSTLQVGLADLLGEAELPSLSRKAMSRQHAKFWLDLLKKPSLASAGSR